MSIQQSSTISAQFPVNTTPIVMGAVVTDVPVPGIQAALTSMLNEPVEIKQALKIPGGASKEAWLVNVLTPEGAREFLLRRAGGSVIHSTTLSLQVEYQVIQAAYAAGVKVAKPYGYIQNLSGREAFVVERVQGESIGRRVVRKPELAGARQALPEKMAEQLVKIHAIKAQDLPVLPGQENPKQTPAGYLIERLQKELDEVAEAHPAIELGLQWLRKHAASVTTGDTCLLHGDFRIGNLMIDADGLVAVFDWEFAHWGDPAEDLAWPLVRAWRFGMDTLHLGGIGPVQAYLDHYNRLSGRHITRKQLFYWELAGNVVWAVGALRQAHRHLSGQERNVEFAVLGRLACEVELEILCLIEKASHAG